MDKYEMWESSWNELSPEQKQKFLDGEYDKLYCQCTFPEKSITGMYCGYCEKPFTKNIQDSKIYKQ